MSQSKLERIFDENLSYNEPAKKAFHAEAKRVLKLLAAAMGLQPDQYDLRSNMAGIAVSGEITLHTDNVYVCLSQRSSTTSVLYRTCKGRKDYSGNQNRWAGLDVLSPGNIQDFATKLIRLAGDVKAA